MRSLLFIILFIGKVFASTNVLFLTDIHFSPYLQCESSPCQVLTQLIESDIQYWPQILKNDNDNKYKSETSNKLLTEGLQQAAQFSQQSNVQHIFITGDILTHHFDSLFMKYAPLNRQNQDNLTKFSLKTSEYVLTQVKNANKGAKIFYILGNNDGDNADYVVPSNNFLESMTLILSKYLPESNTVTQDFVNGGHYTAELNQHTTIIGINSNILSAINPNKNKAEAQLKWLSNKLAIAKKEGKHVIILQHIPYGIDMYATIQKSNDIMQIIVPVMNEKLQQSYTDLLRQYASVISGIYAGHYHANYLTLLPGNIPLVGSIALNGHFGNNPGFQILKLNNTGNLTDYTSYSCHLSGKDVICQSAYQFNQMYGKNIRDTIRTMPSDITESNVVNYRRFFSGDNSIYKQPIANDKSWQYYFCALNNITMKSYNSCLRKINK